MQPNRYTELFFLDEAAAFAAGHRPCAECRHADYQRFRGIWSECIGHPSNADAIDAKLHADRVIGRKKQTYFDDLARLPDGAYIADRGKAWLVSGGSLFEWADFGYVSRRPRPAREEVEVLTPRAAVAVLRFGYRPSVHRTGNEVH